MCPECMFVPLTEQEINRGWKYFELADKSDVWLVRPDGVYVHGDFQRKWYAIPEQIRQREASHNIQKLVPFDWNQTHYCPVCWAPMNIIVSPVPWGCCTVCNYQDLTAHTKYVGFTPIYSRGDFESKVLIDILTPDGRLMTELDPEEFPIMVPAKPSGRTVVFPAITNEQTETEPEPLPKFWLSELPFSWRPALLIIAGMSILLGLVAFMSSN